MADDRTMFSRCGGPTAACPLVSASGTCPLHDEADTVIYDQDVVTPDLLVLLLAKPPRASVYFAKANGSSGPIMTHVLSGGVVRAR